MTRLDELKIFSECCREILLTQFKNNAKASKLIKESTGFEVCHLALTGKFPTSYSTKVKQSLMESVIKITSMKSYLQEFGLDDAAKIYNKGKEIVDNTSATDITNGGVNIVNKAGQVKDTIVKDVEAINKEAEKIHNDSEHPLKQYNDKYDSNQGIVDGVKNYFGLGDASALKRADLAQSDYEQQNNTHPHTDLAMIDHRLKSINKYNDVYEDQHSHQILAGVAAGAAAIYGAYKLYKYFVKKNSVNIVRKSPAEATVAMANLRHKGRLLQLQALQRSMSTCSKSKNPAQCQKVIKEKISKLRAKIGR